MTKNTAGTSRAERHESGDIEEWPVEVHAVDSDPIVVDLRAPEARVSLDATIDLRTVRNLPVAIDIAALKSASGLRLNDATEFLDAEQLEREADSEPETKFLVGENDPLLITPILGLATASATKRAAKRSADITIASLTLMVLLPFLILIAVLVKTTSRGPVLYRSTRVGKNGSEFTFLKFRSMRAGAADDRERLEDRNEQAGPVFKIKNDPRVTPLGYFIRRASIDELPQLLHVISGKMSLVGPRPALPDEVAQYDARARQRLAVKPGITCIWQVSGRSSLDFQTWIDMDVEYIRSWTLLGDMKLLVRTVPTVLMGRGAY